MRTTRQIGCLLVLAINALSCSSTSVAPDAGQDRAARDTARPDQARDVTSSPDRRQPDRTGQPDRSGGKEMTVKPDQLASPDGPSINCSKAMDAVGVGLCDMILGTTWDGKACVSISGCSCQGADCKALFMDTPSCQKAYAACLCGPMAAAGVGACKLLLGWTWNGKACVALSGCSCQGADCALLFSSLAACQQAYSLCP